MLFCLSPLCGDAMQQYILDSDKKPTSALIELLTLFDLPHENTLESIIVQTQTHWLQPGKERWELEELYPEKKSEAIPLLERLGCVDATSPTKNHYTYGVVPGARLSSMQARLEALIAEWKRGVRFDTLVLLTGQRPLGEIEVVQETLKTEADALLYLLENMDLPEDLKRFPG